MKQLNNDNILKFEEVIKSADKYYLVTEYCENRTLEAFYKMDLKDYEII